MARTTKTLIKCIKSLTELHTYVIPKARGPGLANAYHSLQTDPTGTGLDTRSEAVQPQ